MASPLHKAIKQVLKEIDSFLTSSLKDQTLDKAVQKERTKLIESLKKLYTDFAELKPSKEKEEQRPNTIRMASIGSQPSEEGEGIEDNVSQTTVAALKNPTMRGYLFQRKRGDGKQKMFKQKKDPKKYCVVHENVMYWFIKPLDKTFHGAVFLDDCVLEEVSRKEKEFLFQLVFPTKNTTYEFQADNKEDLDEWKKAVETGIHCGIQKQADAVDGVNPYFDCESRAQPKREATYANEAPDEEESGACELYAEPDAVHAAIEDFTKRKGDLTMSRHSMPRERPPSPPKPDADSPSKLPLKGKAPKETKTTKTKKPDKAQQDNPNITINNTNDNNISNKSTLPKNDSNSKTLPQNKTNKTPIFSSAGKPKTLSEVKLKPVTMPRPGMQQQQLQQRDGGGDDNGDNDDNDDVNFKDDDNFYETVESVASSVAQSKGLSVPTSQPPGLPHRNQNVYVNDPDQDHLVYELE